MQALRNNVSLRAIIFAWLAAGTVFLVTNLILMPVMLDVSAELVLRYSASLVLGENVLIDTSTTPLIVGTLVHYILSLIFTLVIALVVHRWGLIVGLVGGAILGLAIYVINIYTMTVLFEWFFALHSTVFMLSHVLFGLVAGGVYELFDTFDMPEDVEVRA